MGKRTKQTKKIKRVNKAVARRKALQDWSIQVRERDGFKCAVCGADKYLQAHHILFKERYPEFSLSMDNGICLCAKCHKFGKLSFHKNPMWSIQWLRINRPDQFAWCFERME